MKAEENKTVQFIREQEDEVEILFKDWHIEKLASVLEHYHQERLKEISDDDIDNEFGISGNMSNEKQYDLLANRKGAKWLKQKLLNK